MLYTVYILFSGRHKKIYVGFTSNLIQRFNSHNIYGKEWTASFRPWIVIYTEVYNDKLLALKREKELKGGRGRQWIHEKIKKEFYQQGFISA